MGTVRGDLVHVVGGGHDGRFNRGAAVVNLAAKAVAATQTRSGAGGRRCAVRGNVGRCAHLRAKNSV